MAKKPKPRSQIAINLKNARLAAGFESISDAARHIGIPIPSAVAHEGAGTSFRKPKLEQLRRYAIAYNTTIDALEGGTLVGSTRPAATPTRIIDVPANLVSASILGTAQAGNWLEVDPFTLEAAGQIPVKRDRDFVFAINVSGDSMNRIIQDGDIAVVRPWTTMKRDPRANDVLLVQRERNGRFELTVKTWRDGKLWPESTNPKWRHPVPMKNGDTITVIGLVVGIYRQL